MVSDISGRNCKIRWVEYSTRQNNQSLKKKNHEEKEKKNGVGEPKDQKRVLTISTICNMWI